MTCQIWSSLKGLRYCCILMTSFFTSPSTPPLILMIYKPILIPSLTGYLAIYLKTVNSSKTKCMLLSQKCSQAHHLPPFYLNGSVIEPVEHCKYLGFWISSNLTWIKNVESVSCKAQRLLSFMFTRFSPLCKPETSIILSKSQVLPIVDYACVVWDPHLKKDHHLLESVQTFTLRMASRTWMQKSSTANSNSPHLPADAHISSF